MHPDVFRSENSQSLRSLSVVDDYKIRKDLFSASSNLLKRIRKLEKDHADFLRCDQILYQDWYNLTFRSELQEGEALENRHRVLTTFHVHLKHVANTASVSLETAYKLLKEEEIQYQEGDEAWRFVIERLRQNRFESATKPKQGGDFSVRPHAAEAIIDFTDIFFKDDSVLSGLKRRARSVYHYLNDIDDNMMARHMSVPAAGYQLFKETFQIAMRCGDWKLLSRIWRASDSAHQQRFLRNMPSHLREFLQQIISENTEEEVIENQQMETENMFRATYRRLARLLHPDLQSSDVSLEYQEWASIKWQRVQDAYKKQDLEGLQRIEILCKAEQGQLNDLTADEIYQSSIVLSDELEALNKSLRESKKHPAWKFSTRRSYDLLKKRVQIEIEERFAPLRSEVEALEKLLKEISQTPGRA